MEQVEDIQKLILINVQNVEAEVQLLLFIVASEVNQAIDEIVNRDLRFVVALGHVKVQTFAEVRLVNAEHILDVLHKIFLGQCGDAFKMSAWHLILFRLAPEILESIMDGSELDFVDFEVITQLFIVVLVRHLRCLKRKLVLLANALFYLLHLDTSEVLDQIIDNLWSIALD